MGHRFPWCCGVSAVLAWSVGARAEDIGHEPLAPRDGAAALSLRGPSSASLGGDSSGNGGGPLSPRGPSASAEHPAVDKGGEYKPRRHWYGWQTLIVDGVASVALVAVGARNQSDNPEGWLTGIAVGYVVAPPIIHLAHGHAGKAALSFALRAAGPLLIAGGVANGNGNGNGNVGLAILGVLAIPAAIAIDAAVIAREDVPTETSFLQRVGFAPWVDPRRGAGGLVLDLRL